MGRVREPAVAGMFYPGSRASLSREVDGLLSRAQAKLEQGKLKALVVPHAGYMYSGETAANAYGLLAAGAFPTVIIVGPSHREYFDGVSVYPGEAYETPLGRVFVDVQARSDLLEAGAAIEVSDTGHGAEHAVEVQLPFLQKTLGQFSFVPVVMGDQSGEYCRLLGDALADVGKKHNVLLVASSDLSHYHPYDTAVLLDRKVITDVERFDPDSLLNKLERREAEACGGGPMVAVMYAAKKLGADASQILFHCNSGDVIDKKDAVVGYLAAAFFQRN